MLKLNKKNKVYTLLFITISFYKFKYMSKSESLTKPK